MVIVNRNRVIGNFRIYITVIINFLIFKAFDDKMNTR